ncbi:hypothetical protein Tco_0348240 [Tanacetum coccineum]
MWCLFDLTSSGWCNSFHGLQSKDPNQDLKDFLKLMDSLDLNGDNRKRTRLMDSFQGFSPKCPSSWYQSLAPNPNFYDHVNPITRRTIDQAVDGKLRDRNDEESWALLEELALYDNES